MRYTHLKGGSYENYSVRRPRGWKRYDLGKMLTDYDGSVQISTGDILRGAVKAGSELGKKAQGYMDRGDLVPDSLIMDIMESRLQEPDCKNGFILDGFPRTISQADPPEKPAPEAQIETRYRRQPRCSESGHPGPTDDPQDLLELKLPGNL